MIGTVLQKEITENLLGPKFLITLAISMVLVLTSIFSGYKLYESEMEWYTKAQSHNVNRLENLGSYRRLETEGSKVLRKPEKMSIFVKGVDSAVGRSALVSRDPDVPIRDSRFGLNPIFAVFGELDLAFIVKFILSLFAFLFSYNAISGEKETGTLKLVLSYPLSKAAYIFGKTVGGITILLLTLFLPVLVGLVMLMTAFNVNFSPSEMARLGLLLLSFSLYLIVFYLVGMFMSSLNKQSSVSFLMCLFIWVMSVAVIPKMSVEIAGQISPAPSIDEVESKRASLERQYYHDFSSRLEDKLKTMFNTGHPERPEIVAVRDELEQEVREVMETGMNEVLEDYQRKRDRLLATAKSIARVSPTSCLTFASNRLAGTDAQLLTRFQRNLDFYKTSFMNFSNDKIALNPNAPGSSVGTSISVTGSGANRSVDISITAPTEKLEVSGLPVYRSEMESLPATVSSVLGDLLILILEAIVLFLAAFVAFLRYDVR